MLTNWALHTLVSSAHTICAQGAEFFQCRIWNETLTVAPYFCTLSTSQVVKSKTCISDTVFTSKATKPNPLYVTLQAHISNIFQRISIHYLVTHFAKTWVTKSGQVSLSMKILAWWDHINLKYKTFLTASHFSCPSCAPDECRGAFQKISPRHLEPSKK